MTLDQLTAMIEALERMATQAEAGEAGHYLRMALMEALRLGMYPETEGNELWPIPSPPIT